MSHRVDTVLPADSVEFCPSPTSRDIFAVGTYKLDEKGATTSDGHELETARRRGKCLLFEVNVSDDHDRCNQLQEISMSAVLDMKWSSDNLAIADAEGNITLYRLSKENRNLDLVENICVSPKSLCLSLDWAKDRLGISSDTLATSCSDGSIVITKHTPAGLIRTDSWIAHEFEPWITAWDRWHHNQIYTGGDDCKLKGWDRRTGYQSPIFTNKQFDGGVTAIQSSPHAEHVLAVGSYDAIVRIFDTRRPSKPVAQVTVGGGAWRVKWHYDPRKMDYLLVACMHDGFKIVRLDNSKELEMDRGVVSFRFDKHDSLAYGVDWSYADPTEQGSLVGSCSFYDHQLRLWRVRHDVQ